MKRGRGHARGAAAAEEQAELRALRSRADATGQEVSLTAAALAGRLAETARPRTLIRRTAAQAGTRARQAARRAVGEPAARLRLAAAAGAAAGLILVAVAVTWQHHRRG
ncbi:MAG TPA: hypothetical protein VGI96_45180 [Streptosporangiaceae bacterium]|jgi:hypothetical protein